MKLTVAIGVLIVGGCLMMEKKTHDMKRHAAQREENARSSAKYRALDYISGETSYLDDSDLDYLDDEMQNKVFDERKERQEEMFRNLLEN